MAYRLPANVYSPDHIRYCIEELEAYGAALAKEERGATNAATWGLSAESLSLTAGLSQKNELNPEAMTELATKLQQILDTAKVMGITLAAPASYALKEELVTWLRTNILPDMLVEFHVNPDIAGGMILRSTNKVYDYSFRKLILGEPERFTRILENV